MKAENGEEVTPGFWWYQFVNLDGKDAEIQPVLVYEWVAAGYSSLEVSILGDDDGPALSQARGRFLKPLKYEAHP